MSVPVVLRAVDCKIYRAVRLLHPDVLHLIQAHEVCLRAASVDDLNPSVVLAVVHHVVYDRVDRSDSDTAGNYENVLAFERAFNRESVSDRAAQTYFLADFRGVKPFCDAAALLDREFHVRLKSRGGCY